MDFTLRFQLSLMMFLEYFIKGAWFVTLGTYLATNLKATGLETANIFSTQSLGAVIAPFFIGLIADRYINAEKLLGVLHLFGAFLLYMMYSSTSAASFYPYVLVYFIAYMSSLAISNAISFRHLPDAKKQFPTIRVWGTIGWITSGVAISYIFHWDQQEAIAMGALGNTFLLGTLFSLLLGIFSFTLPATPPIKHITASKNITTLLGLDALRLLRRRDFFIFIITAILICIPLSFYYQNANPFLTAIGLPNPTAKMALGQFSEALCLLLVPLFFRKLGYKKMIIIGITAWVIRYLLFAYGDADSLAFMLILGIILHGVCYDFLFVVGQIYTDTIAGEQYKSSAQGLVTVAMYGVGMLIGFWIAGYIGEYLKAKDVTNYWWQLWMYPATIAAAVLVVFIVLFKGKTAGNESSSLPG
ncbi:MFS transporter [Olivibacter sp. SDN3]|uniref:MFS transporter n=1 Tax=Olivibacter sp. SDN3 TaxID=2764720 RepID=UPI001651A818|nr:MFS transporter [Olivibacter sp. SDN3]QNL49228.1 MFS transporter [Olivibacter sp. SDN3]